MWKRQRSTSDFVSEVESHIAIETDRLVAAGMSEDEARHAARRAFCNVTTRVEHFHASRSGMHYVDSPSVRRSHSPPS